MPAWACEDRVSSSASTGPCLSTHSTTRSPGLARAMRVVDGGDLVEHQLDLLAAGALGHPRPSALGDELGGDAAPAPAQHRVLADHEHVEVLGGDGSQLPDVVVAAVAGGRRPCRSATAWPRSVSAAWLSLSCSTKSPSIRIPGALWQ